VQVEEGLVVATVVEESASPPPPTTAVAAEEERAVKEMAVDQVALAPPAGTDSSARG
jgi:hypothetical protein